MNFPVTLLRRLKYVQYRIQHKMEYQIFLKIEHKNRIQKIEQKKRIVFLRLNPTLNPLIPKHEKTKTFRCFRIKRKEW